MEYLSGHDFKVKINDQYFEAEREFSISRSAEFGVLVKKTGNEKYVKTTSWSLALQLYFTDQNHADLIAEGDVVVLQVTDGSKVFEGRAVVTGIEESFNALELPTLDVTFMGVSEQIIKTNIEAGLLDGDLLETTLPFMVGASKV